MLLVGTIGPVRCSQFVLHFLVDFNCLEVTGRPLEVKGIRCGNESSFAVSCIEVCGLHFDVSLSDVEVVVSLSVGLVLAMRK